MQIEIINHSSHPLPAYQTVGSAGMDLYAFITDEIYLEPMQRILIPTGLHVALPMGVEAQIRPRSGLAIKQGITCLNTPGTIDSDYRGEIGVLLINHGSVPFEILRGARIAQMVVAPVTRIILSEVSDLSATRRGADGFGSTGLLSTPERQS